MFTSTEGLHSGLGVVYEADAVGEKKLDFPAALSKGDVSNTLYFILFILIYFFAVE